MKVLIVTQYFWPENFRINDLAQGLVDLGHQVTVFTGKPNYPSGRYFPGYGFFRRPSEWHKGVEIKRVPVVPRGSGSAMRLILNYLSFAATAGFLAPFRCREKPDVILVFEPSPVTVGIPALILKRIHRVPILFWVQDLWPESLSATQMIRSRWILRLVERLVRQIYRGCDRILVQSRAFVESVRRLGVDSSRIEYFPNSAEELYQPVDQAPAAAVGATLPDGFRVMFAGNIGAAQDFETILAAADILKPHKEIQWVVVGDGRLAEWVRGEVNRRGLDGHVSLLGRHPLEAMPSFFAAADVMLVTLRRDPIFALTVPSKVQSYLACARPIVAALDGEGAHIIREAAAGIVVPAQDAQRLATAVLDIYRQPRAEREKMGASGRAYYLANFERNMLLHRLDGWLRALK